MSFYHGNPTFVADVTTPSHITYNVTPRFLVIALKDGTIDVYAWAQRPYQKFMVYKSFPQLQHKPQLVDLMINDDDGRRQTLVRT